MTKKQTRTRKAAPKKTIAKQKTQAIDATGCNSWLCPAVLVGEGVGEWERIVGRLLLTGRLTETEPTAVETYCKDYETWKTAQGWINDNGLVAVTRNDKGEVKGISAVPHVAIAARAAAQMRTFLTDHGLTPAAACRVDTNQGETIEVKRARLIRGILGEPAG